MVFNQAKTLLITTIDAPPARCNEWITFEISAKNLGTTINSGILWFEIDENIAEVNIADAPDTIANPNLYGWYYNDLFPSQAITKQSDSTSVGMSWAYDSNFHILN